MTAVGNKHDYARLAALADEHRIPFWTLCERWERGLRGDPLVRRHRGRTVPHTTAHPGFEWLTIDQAAEMLGVGLNSMHDLASKRRGQILLRLSRARSEEPGARVLYRRMEIAAVAEIRAVLDGSAYMALKVYLALRERRLPAVPAGPLEGGAP